MDIHLWLAFVLSFAILSLIPGPSVIMVMSQALIRGKRAALVCVAGDLAGVLVMMSLAFGGIGAVLAASSLAFQAMRWAGVVYLAWLGLGQIRAARRLTDQVPAEPQVMAAGRAGFLTGVLNPKAIGFYLAFLPQFISPDRAHLPQLIILAVTASAVAGIVLAGYALLAARLRRGFRSAPARRLFGYTGGGLMLGGSAVMIAAR
ncbi:LysE family translocator [Paracoccus tegillarcae]|uniref:LysE family translocator n=1 Tax=Paracoccus tegillarcae TaxID=1529068 RepID=A0A2K9F171_9RHOB|nr:LysE family transporter [Paracoccus tegillarcae]AUH32891.1 LysE family translocator [Paracoccus tegillarcae]